MLSQARSLWRALGGRSAFEDGMEAEFRHHVELRTADLVRSGLSPAEARRRARLEFGSPDRYKEEAREARGLRHVDELRADLRYSARSLARSPGFTVAAVLTLALGIGANTSMFSLVNASLLRPLPFEDPGDLVVLHQVYAGPDAEPYPLRWAYPEFEAIEAALTSFSHLAAYTAASVNVAGGREAVRVSAEFVSASYFPALRVRPVVGRGFLPEEDVAADPRPVAILAHDLWVRHFGGAEDVLGETVLVQGVPLRVVGVAPAGFRGLTGGAEIWIPHALGPAAHFPGHLTLMQNFISVVGRLRPGVTVAGARTDVALSGFQAAAGVRAAADPGATMPGEWSAEAALLREALRDPGTVRARLVLAGAVAFLLLIAVTNFSALFLARSTRQARETATRAALGAGRWRLVRQRVVESSLVGLVGGTIGIVLADAGIRVVGAVAPQRIGGGGSRVADLASFAEPALDWRVVAFAALLSLLTGFLAGLVPALRATRRAGSLALATRSGGGSVAVGSLRRPTVLTAAGVIQVACAVVLLVGATMLLQGFQRLRTLDPGFDAAGLVTFQVSPPQAIYGGSAAAPLLERILERVEAVPGVRSATVGCPPYSRCAWTTLHIEGRDAAGPPPSVGRHYVGPDHFRVLGVPLVRGRTLDAGDRPGRPLVVVINETAAARFWPGEDPVGQRVRFASGGDFAVAAAEIVGVVGDVLYGAPGTPSQPEFYTSYLQFTWPWSTVTVRAGGDPLALVAGLRRAVADVDPNLPIHDVRTMSERGLDTLAGERFSAAVLGLFAALGLLLASLGVYGIMAYSVAQRRREIGIRVALGATPSRVLAVILAQGATLALAGLFIGSVAAFWLAGTLPALMGSVDRQDLTVLVAVAPTLLLVALAACVIPARSAARTDPRSTLAAD